MLKLHAGVSKKVGLPGFSSASASCTIEAELDGSLLNDHEGFQIVVRRAYHSCEQAVADQIARLEVERQSEVSVQENPALQSPDSVHGDHGLPPCMNGPQTRSRVTVRLRGVARRVFAPNAAPARPPGPRPRRPE